MHLSLDSYYITKNILKPNLYASFLELRRRNKKRDFISVFIIFTVAMSIFEANLAATVNTMNEKRIIYDDGADIVLKERFPIGKKMDVNLKKAVRYYEEPDYGKYEALKASGLLTTKVMKAKAMLVANNSATTKLDLMAIHTKEFGEVANSIGYLNGEHYFNYLNELAKVRDGALISKNLAENYDIAIGDRLTYARDRELDGNGEKGRMYNTVTVVGIIDSFPGYSKYSYEYDANMKLKEVTNNLIVTNYASEVNFFGIYPYEVWINTANALAFNKGEAVEFINKYLADNDISTEYINSAYSDIAKKKSESMVLITNGLFSLGFMVSVITGMMGMLIYWITSFKEREMIFSVYRAMGMSKGGVSGIIINEQIFASVTAWLFGGGIGVIVPLPSLEHITALMEEMPVLGHQTVPVGGPVKRLHVRVQFRTLA